MSTATTMPPFSHFLETTTDEMQKDAIRAYAKAYAASQRTEQQVNPWRQAVDDALIAHALDCTGPGDDPKEKVKELLEWAATIATDPRVSERAALALQPSASAEPVQGWKLVPVEPTPEMVRAGLDTDEADKDADEGQMLYWSYKAMVDASPVTAAREQEASATGAERIVIREDRFSEHRDTRKVPQHHGYCFGVTVTPRKDAGDLVELFVEDDEFWHFVTAFDVHWLPELTRVLGLATPTTSTTGKVDHAK